MRVYAAPMEGITGYIYRNAHARWYGGADRYFTPFIVPGKKRGFRSRELNDILPEHNEGVPVVPQILTNDWEDFLHTAEILKDYGYDEVNLNLGCPSGTVVSKGRGSGFLAFPQELDRFLDRIFSGTDMKISVKTRIGRDDPEEFGPLLDIFRKYPIWELTVHPRVQKDFYKNRVRWEVFAEAVKLPGIPVCYNGDIFSPEDLEHFREAFPETDRIMTGRGLIADPRLAVMLNRSVEKGGKTDGETKDQDRFLAFHQELLEGYCREMSGDRNVLFKMKELWAYMIHLFPDGEKYGKKIRKAERVADYSLWVRRLVSEQEMLPAADTAFLRRQG